MVRADNLLHNGASRFIFILALLFILLTSLIHPAVAQILHTIAWENQGFPNGATIPSGTVLTPTTTPAVSGALTASLTYSTSGTFTVSPTFTFNSGVVGAHTGLLFISYEVGANPNPATQFITFTLSFSRPIYALSFDLLDIDRRGEATSWEDAVIITYNGSVNVRSTPAVYTLGGPCVVEGTVLTANDGFVGNSTNNPGLCINGNNDTLANGNIHFNFGNIPVSTITIRYSPGTTAPNPSGEQHIGISDITFTMSDFGDAPASYGDASHALPATLSNYLGSIPPDAESTSQYSADALGDDNAGNNDEDAFASDSGGFITLPTPLHTGLSGSAYLLNVPCTGTGNVAGWIDFNINGTFEGSERSAGSCSTSNATLNWSIPTDIKAGATYMRLRMADDPTQLVNPVGDAASGEVEDYRLNIRAAMRVVKRLLPPTDPGRFNLQLTGTPTPIVPAGSNNPALNAGDGDSTGWLIIQPGATYTASETAASGTNLADYTTSYSCVNAAGTTLSTGNGTSISVTPPLNGTGQEQTITCTFTNMTGTDLSIIKTDNPDPVYVNGQFDYFLTVTNNGGVDAVNVVVTDTLPTGTTYVSATGSGWSCSHAAGIVTCTRPLLGANTTAPIITVTVTAPGTPGTVINRVVVTSDNRDTNPDNNSDDEDTLIVSSDPNHLVKRIVETDQSFTDGTNVAIGEIVTYRVLVTVPPATLTNARMVDTLTQGLAFVDCISIEPQTTELTTSIPGGFQAICNNTPPTLYTVDDPTGGSDPVNAGRRVTFPLGTLTNSSSGNLGLAFTYRVVVLDSPGNVDGKNLPNNAVFAWDGGSLSASTTVNVVEPKLTIRKIVNTTTVALGSSVTFTLQIQHAANSHTNAYDTILEDPLPPELEYVTGSLDCTAGTQDPDVACEYVAATRTIRAGWSNFVLGGGNGLVRFQARVTAIPPGGIENIASVSWTSLPGSVPGPLSPYNPQYSHERFHDPGSAVDIYFSQTALRLRGATGLAAAGITELPTTGFPPGRVTDLSHTPPSTYHSTGELRLSIPAIGINTPILGIPLEQGNWNTSWLNDQAGWLEGSAFPTWSGNSVLTGHIYLANGLPGPFIKLDNLRWGDQVIVYAFGSKYIYEVRSNQIVNPRDTSVLQHEDLPWLTLITCKGYDENTNSYHWRVVVRAVLVKVE